MSMTTEPVAWFVDWPGEPDLGHFLGEEPVEGARNRALVFRDAAPVSAEPVGKLECHVSGDATFWPDEAKVLALPVGEHAVYTAPVAAQAQPAALTDEYAHGVADGLEAAAVSAEPVAWMNKLISLVVSYGDSRHFEVEAVDKRDAVCRTTQAFADLMEHVRSAPVAAQANKMPDAARIALDSLDADAVYLLSRVKQGTLSIHDAALSIRQRIEAARAATGYPVAAQIPTTWRESLEVLILNYGTACIDNDGGKTWKEIKSHLDMITIPVVAQAQPLPDSLIPIAPDLEYLRGAVENTALPAFLRGQIVAAVTALQQPVSGADRLPIELCGISEAIGNGGGFWRSCSGCHESNEGMATGPFSKTLKCHLGVGCSECGGIGAIWDTTDYDAMGDFMAAKYQQDADKLDALNKACSELWAIAHTYDDHELRGKAKEAYEMTAATDAARKEAGQ